MQNLGRKVDRLCSLQIRNLGVEGRDHREQHGTDRLCKLSEYLKKREIEEDALLAGHPEWSPAGLRERLMARRKTR